MPAMTSAFASLERSELSDATPQLNVVQRVGGSIGTAVLAVILERALVGVTTPAEAASAYGETFWWPAGRHHRAGDRALHRARPRGAHGPCPRPQARPGVPVEAIAESVA